MNSYKDGSWMIEYIKRYFSCIGEGLLFTGLFVCPVLLFMFDEHTVYRNVWWICLIVTAIVESYEEGKRREKMSWRVDEKQAEGEAEGKEESEIMKEIKARWKERDEIDTQIARERRKRR